MFSMYSDIGNKDTPIFVHLFFANISSPYVLGTIRNDKLKFLLPKIIYKLT